jgi:acetoin utilization protein AcuB
MTQRDRTRVPTTVSEAMTPGAHCIGADQVIALAASHMAEWHIRHLPVLEAGQLVGVLSERDIALLRSVVPDQADQMSVEEAMTAVPYCVAPDAPLAEVAHHMALRKLGSAIVVDQGKIAGVFTTTDALELLATMLENGASESITRRRSTPVPAGTR